MSSEEVSREIIFKVLVVGELACGKTAIIRCYIHNTFSENYKSTIGVDFALKKMRYSPNLMVQLQLWDIAGQARFTNMTRVYYREAVAAFIVFDVTRRSTLDAVAKWRDDLRAIVKLPDGRDIPIVLLANKCDLGGEINAQQMDKFCKENDFIGWFETSAKDNINIEPAMNFMVDSIMRYLPPNSKNFMDSSEESDSDIVSLDESDDPPRNSRCCFT